MLELHCIVCTTLIPEPRAIRGGRTCGNDCAREAKRRCARGAPRYVVGSVADQAAGERF